jgi:hypothetical protein
VHRALVGIIAVPVAVSLLHDDVALDQKAFEDLANVKLGYVGNLPYGISEKELRDLFEAHGEVSSVAVIMDKFTGQSKGFGFVEMPSRDQAVQAIESLNGHNVQGRDLRVNEARPRNDDFRGGGGGGGGRRDRY